MKEPKEILLMCACGEIMRVDDLVNVDVLICRSCPRKGCFEQLCTTCRGTEIVDAVPCHCVFD